MLSIIMYALKFTDGLAVEKMTSKKIIHFCFFLFFFMEELKGGLKQTIYLTTMDILYIILYVI